MERSLSGGALGSVLLAAAIPTVDATALVIALPTITRDFHAGWLMQQWLLNASTLTLASLLLPAGMVGDRFGRRRMLRLGLCLVIGGTLLSALSANTAALIVGRVAVGAGGAGMLPATIALVRSGTGATESRTRGFGQLAAWVGLGSTIAPLLAGMLIDAASWRAIFALSAAPAVVALWLSSALPEERIATTLPKRLAVGALAGGAALSALTFTAIDAGAVGFTAVRTGVGLGAALLASVIAGLVLRRLPEAATISRNWLAGNAQTFVLYFGLIGLTYLLTTYPQATAGWSATRAATVAMPTTLATWLLSPTLGGLVHRFGTRSVMVAATALAVLGLAWVSLAVSDTLSGWGIAAGAAVFGVGLALAAAPLTQAAVTSVSNSRAGLASAVNHAVVRVAGLAATIGLGALASGGTGDYSPPRLRTALVVSAVIVGVGGLALVTLFRDREAGGVSPAAEG